MKAGIVGAAALSQAAMAAGPLAHVVAGWGRRAPAAPAPSR